MFFQNQGYGYITELGETGTMSTHDVVDDRDVYFRASDLRVRDPHAVLRKSCTGHIVEYERETDDQGRHRAFDITNLYQTALPCEEGVVVFKRYYDINREILKREGARLVDGYIMSQAQAHNQAPQKRNRRHSRKPQADYRDDGRRSGSGNSRCDTYSGGGGGGGGGSAAASTEYLDSVTRTTPDPDVDDLSMDGDAD
jgi:uncharacterized membrane protein YgcG